MFDGDIPVLQTTGNDTNDECLCNGDIKSIVTKEQFEQIKYKVKE